MNTVNEPIVYAFAAVFLLGLMIGLGLSVVIAWVGRAR